MHFKASPLVTSTPEPVPSPSGRVWTRKPINRPPRIDVINNQNGLPIYNIRDCRQDRLDVIIRLQGDVELRMNGKEKSDLSEGLGDSVFIVFESLVTHLVQTHFDVWMRFIPSVKAAGKRRLGQ